MNILPLITLVLITTTFAEGEETDAFISCGRESFLANESMSYITDGYRCGRFEFPWLAVLNYRFDNNPRLEVKCSGMVINKRYILTAAHCLDFNRYSIVSIWLGVQKLSESDGRDIQKFTIAKTIVHPDYNSATGTHDIALLKLNKDIRFSTYISRICLPAFQEAFPPNGTMLHVAGWGHEAFEGVTVDWKLKTRVPIYSYNECTKRLNKRIRNDQICVEGEWMKGTCWGDGGGPVMESRHVGPYITWYAVGIITLDSRNCGFNERPNVHTRVSYYIEWIEHIIRGSP